ncbi:MAG: isochorismatase [Bacteroidota bacterium]|nr:isochorismatase [Bacteroidota bacterium]
MGTTSETELPIPSWFKEHLAGSAWRVDYAARAADAVELARSCKIGPASEDTRRVCLLLVDCQNTFCIPGFELFVGGRSGNGAVEDNVRLATFMYKNLPSITQIIPTMDTHRAMQIFHPLFFVDKKGNHPAPMTMIFVSDIESGKWKVNPAVAQVIPGKDENALYDFVLHYTRTLSKNGKYTLMIWPYHAMLGGIGHALVASIEEAIFVHTIARQCQTQFEMKGNLPLTENYSVLRPEVLDDEQHRSITAKNTALIESLLSFDAVIVAGQAKSHCVAWTVDDLLTEIKAKDPSLARKIYLLEDCTSPVVVPGADFTDQANEAFRRFAEAGMHIVKSSEPISSWLEM